jgi:hypothetical protein
VAVQQDVRPKNISVRHVTLLAVETTEEAIHKAERHLQATSCDALLYTESDEPHWKKLYQLFPVQGGRSSPVM